MEIKMNLHLNKVSNWLATIKLSLIIDKTVYMEFGSTRNSIPGNLNICIQGKQITRVDSTKYLEIIIDSNMRWKNHL